MTLPSRLPQSAFLVVAALALSCAACSSDADPPRTDLGAEGTGGAASQGTGGSGASGSSPGGSGPDATLPPGYPAGPFGGTVGDIIYDYQFEGFVNESAVGDPLEQRWEPYSMNAMRDAGKSYALLVLAETWCIGCRATAGHLGTRADELAALDAVVVEVLLSGDRGELEAWVETYDLTVTTVFATSSSMSRDLGGRERGVIVDLATMQIVYNRLGAFSADSTLLEDALTELAARGAVGS